MNISYLNMFVEVARQKSISTAGQKLNISQSALSQQIKQMEQSLNARLFERSNKGVQLTKIGEVVYQYAVQTIGAYEQMVETIDSMQNTNKVLSICATPVVCDYALPCTLYHLKKKFPNINIELSTMSSAMVEEKVSYGQGHIGFIVGKPKNKALEYKKVFSDPMYLVAGENMKVPSAIKKKDLYKYPILMLNYSQRTRELINIYLEGIGIDLSKLKILYSLDSNESIKLSTLRDYGMAFLPYMSVKKELYQKQLKIIECEDFELENSFYLIKKGQQEHSDEQVNKLIKYIEKVLKETIC